MSSGPWTAYASKDEDGPWAKYSQAEQSSESETPPPKPGTWEKLTRSYNPDVENFAAAHPMIGPAARFFDAAGGAALSTPSALYGMAGHPIDTAENIGKSLAAWGKPETWKGIPSVLPEALGQGVGSVAAGEGLGAVPGVGKAAIAVRDTAGRVLRTPEGELKPLVRATAKVGGIAAGRALGLPGEFAGYAVGPELADAIIPKHPAQRIPSLDATAENIPFAGEKTPPVSLPSVAQGSQAPSGLPTVEQAGPPPSIRRTPGQIAPESVGAPQERVPLTPMTPPTVNLPAGGTMRGPQPLLPASTAPEQASAGLPSVEGPAKPTGSALGRLEGLIREASGKQELKPNVPLRQQWSVKPADYFSRYQSQMPSNPLDTWKVGNAEIHKVSEIPDFPEIRDVPQGRVARAWTQDTSEGPKVFIKAGLPEDQFHEALKHELAHVQNRDFPTFSKEYPELTPLRQQSVGAAGQGFPAVGDSMQNLGGQVSFRREPIIKTVPGLEEGPLRAQAPEKLPAVATEEPARQLGAPPLQPAVPLRQQVKVTGMEPPSRQQTLEQKYPDRELRQLVHANGEDIVDATKDDRETLKAIHDLKNPDVREVAINGGINMVGENGSPIMVNNRKASGDISRQEVFKQLLAKGYTPKQIVDLAKQSP